MTSTRKKARFSDLIVPSPTFTLSQSYDLPDFAMTHFDLYRLGEAEEVFDLGWDDARADGVTLVEWPDRLGPLRPPEALEIRLEATGAGEEQRQLHGVGGPAWVPRLEPIFS